MSNQNKHKPLNPDELFKLLEESSNSSDSSFSNQELNHLDDFEKEALEGFATHTTPAKAKALMEEIDLEISKKTQPEEGSGRKNKIIWFSAAASLVFVISLSVFLINQTKKEQESNIALNEVKSTGEIIPAKEIENKPQETPIVTEATEEGTEKEKLKQISVVTDLNAKQTEPDTKLAEEKALESFNIMTQAGKGVASETTPVATGSTQNQLNYKKNDNANYDVDAVTLSDKTTVADDREESKKKEADQITSTTNGVAANYNEVLTTKSLSKPSKNEVTKERAVFKKNKTSKNSTNAAKFETAVAEMEFSAATVPASVNNSFAQGYFVGGEVSIKDQVLTYFKNKSITQTFKGTFKVIATIDEKGKLSVDTITSVNNACADCIKPLKEALNTMSNWQPALQQGKPVSSKTGFTLIF